MSRDRDTCAGDELSLPEFLDDLAGKVEAAGTGLLPCGIGPEVPGRLRSVASILLLYESELTALFASHGIEVEFYG